MVFKGAHFLHELAVFTSKLAYSGVFALFLLASIMLSHYFYPRDAVLPRYDFLFIVAVCFQVFLVWKKLETIPEVIVIMVFHVLAMIMEWFKTQDAIGSWFYPEAFYLGVGKVPLFAGFMYSAVGSAIARGMRVFRMELIQPPNLIWMGLLSALIYLNFFTHHYILNLRWVLLALAVVSYWRTQIRFVLVEFERSVSIIWAFAWVAVCLWLAENIATYAQVWLYPIQKDGWQLVDWDRMVAWYLLIQLSFALVYGLTQCKPSTAKKVGTYG